jgi:DNA mismatch repair protein MutS2
LEARFEEALERVEADAERTIEEIGQKQSADKARLKSARLKREFSEQVEQITAKPAVAKAPLDLKEGARVRLKGIREPARVRRLLGADAIEVEAGFLKLQVPRSDVLEVLEEQEPASKLPKNVRFQAASVPSWSLAQRELNVIGKHAQDALDEVDKFLDSASLASVERVRIVHGHGMGVLKRAVAEMLKKHPLVEKFQEATPSEGGAGATIVELR